MRIVVTLRSIEDMLLLSKEASRLSGNVDCIKDRYTIDAKSIIGLMSIGAGKCEIFVEDRENDLEKFVKAIKPITN